MTSMPEAASREASITVSRGYSARPSVANNRLRKRRNSASVPPPARPSALTTATFDASSAPRLPGIAPPATLADRVKVSTMVPTHSEIGWPIAQNTRKTSSAISQ